jgi:signal transduction histidine kinase
VEHLSTMMHEITARKEAEATQQFLIEASRTLSGSIEFDQVLREIAEVIVPRMADFCLIDLISPDGHIYRPMVLHRDPAKQALIDELRRYPPAGGQLFGVPRVIQTGVSEVVPDITEVWLRVIAHDEDHFRVMQRLRPVSALIISLRARGKVIGAVTGVYAESERHYSTDDLRVAESLAARAALAIDNAELYRGLQHALRTRDEVLRIVAHDLRNPLNTISLSTDMLFESMPPDLARHCGPQLEIIRRATDRANRLIGDLLDVARLQAGKLSVECHPVETVPLLEEALALQDDLAKEHGIRLIRRFHGELPPIMADHDRILQVFGNLIGNALKFTPEGGTITVAAERMGEVIQFSVADTGPGIPEEETAYLFDAFWQARTGTGEGTGLGLTICRGIINAHGGRIWVRSKVGAGSTFYFTLPLAGGNQKPTGDANL